MSEFKDLAVEGDAIKAMARHMRFFTILPPEPRYETVPSLEDPSKGKEKLIVNVELANGSHAEYYPNKTSSRKIANLAGTTDMKKWIGLTFLWGSIIKQKIGGADKNVLYVTHKIKDKKEAEEIAKKLAEEE
ncbi:MAG: hypothetical protein KKD18_06645 [Nanoarchaeota archaeon]|nr:hypothetical protein [Nanoarchaeota archaeon]